MKSLNWGILGTGGIAKKFARALPESRTGKLVAVGSRKQKTAEEFGEMFGLSRNHSGYGALLADPAVDAVYNSLPNSLHLEWTIKAMESGKAVLCEKPLTKDADETAAMISAAKENGVFLMEAFMYRCHPQTARLIELIQEKAIGQIRLLHANFAYNLGNRKTGDIYRNIRLRHDVAGGSIMDVGCYTMSMARLVGGAAAGLTEPIEPLELKAFGCIGKGDVDEWASAVVRFPGDLIASLTCGSMVAVHPGVHIWGTRGNITVPDPWIPKTGKILLSRTGEGTEELEVPSDPASCYALEADLVAENLDSLEAPYPAMTWKDSLGNMKALDRWREEIGLEFT